ncbi:MAG: hypothetical protein ACWA5L_02555 [bacterium]
MTAAKRKVVTYEMVPDEGLLQDDQPLGFSDRDLLNYMISMNKELEQLAAKNNLKTLSILYALINDEAERLATLFDSAERNNQYR